MDLIDPPGPIKTSCVILNRCGLVFMVARLLSLVPYAFDPNRVSLRPISFKAAIVRANAFVDVWC